jgi:hypothetical protein
MPTAPITCGSAMLPTPAHCHLPFHIRLVPNCARFGTRQWTILRASATSSRMPPIRLAGSAFGASSSCSVRSSWQPLAAAAALIDAVLGAVTTIGSATIRQAACLIYEHLYAAYEYFRLAVGMNGLAFPLVAHLPEERIRHFANPSLRDANGRTALDILASMPSHPVPIPGLLHNEVHRKRRLGRLTGADADGLIHSPPDWRWMGPHLCRKARSFSWPAGARLSIGWR